MTGSQRFPLKKLQKAVGGAGSTGAAQAGTALTQATLGRFFTGAILKLSYLQGLYGFSLMEQWRRAQQAGVTGRFPATHSCDAPIMPLRQNSVVLQCLAPARCSVFQPSLLHPPRGQQEDQAPGNTLST